MRKIVSTAMVGDQMHLCVAYDDILLHTVRYANGGWSNFGNVKEVAGDCGSIVSIALCEGIADSLHIAVISTDGNVLHSIRKSDRTWTKFGDVRQVAAYNHKVGKNKRPSAVTLSALSDGGVQLSIVVDDSEIYHTIRLHNGSWSELGRLQSASNDKILSISASQGSDDSMHLTYSSLDNNLGNLYHCLRFSSGGWTKFYSIFKVLNRNGVDAIRDLSKASVNDGDMHLVLATARGRLYHAVRHKDHGDWDGFGDVESQIGSIGNPISVSCCGDGKDLHVVVVNDTMQIFHSIRNSQGQWTKKGNVEDVVRSSTHIPVQQEPPSTCQRLSVNPSVYAKLSRWIYGKHSLPSGFMLRKELIRHGVKFAYVHAPKIGNVFVIRGSVNGGSNYAKDAEIILSGGKVFSRYANATKDVLKLFISSYGPCCVAVGHSLGGRLVEFACETPGVLGVTFNALVGNKSSRIIAFRADGDVAQLFKGHTDHWIKTYYVVKIGGYKKYVRKFPPFTLDGHMIGTTISYFEEFGDRNDIWRNDDINKINAF